MVETDYPVVYSDNHLPTAIHIHVGDKYDFELYRMMQKLSQKVKHYMCT